MKRRPTVKIRWIGLLALAAGAALLLSAGDESRWERKRREEIKDLTEKFARRLRYEGLTQEQLYLHRQAAALLERVKQEKTDRYRFDRLAHATEALLEASQRIQEAKREQKGADEEDDQREAARDLEKDYFRVRQADYFARQAKEKEAGDFVRLARKLYQQARAAYDAGDFDKAEDLGDAASYVARAVEYLAQAAIPVPEPPRL